jgi:hypothetical protein
MRKRLNKKIDRKTRFLQLKKWRQSRAAISDFEKKGGSIEDRDFAISFEEKIFGGQDAHAGLAAFRAVPNFISLEYHNPEIAEIFQTANHAYAEFLGELRRYPEVVQANMTSNDINRRISGASAPELLPTRPYAESLHTSAIALARANDQLLAKIKSLASGQK